jgi:hypothetical protein
MPTPRQKPFAPSGRASGPRSHAPRARRSSGRWKSGWLNSTRGSSRSTRAPGSNPAGGAARAGWLESFRSRRALNGLGKPRALKPGDRQRQTSNAVAVVGAAVAEVAEVGAVAKAASDLAKAGSRSPFRVRRVLSEGHPEGSAGIAHPDSPPQGAREKCAEATPRADRRPQGPREICLGVRRRRREMSSDDADAGVGGVDAARDRTVRRRLAARRVAARRPINRPRPPEFAGIEWTNGALP